jgi:hypothetical protein
MRRSYYLGLSWSVLATAALLAACGGSQPAATTPAEPGAEPAAEAPAGGGAELVWSDDMPMKDKGTFMKQKVMPVMSKIFKDHDAKEFGNFSCKTCHGADMKPKPVQALPELHFKDGKLTEADKMPEMVKFMHDEVSPKMAELFGKQPYDPATKTGFGCNGCHNIQM